MTRGRSLDKSWTVKILKFFIEAVWWLSWLAAALMIFVMIILAAGFQPEALQVKAPVKLIMMDEDDYDFAEIPYDQRPLVTEITGMANVLVDPRDTVFRWYIIVTAMFLLTGLLWGMYNLRTFFRTVRAGDPFDKKNPGRIRWLGALTMAAGPFTQSAMYIQGEWVLRNFDLPGVRWEVADIEGGWTILAGLLIIVIGQIFQMGVKMKEEQELTV